MSESTLQEYETRLARFASLVEERALLEAVVADVDGLLSDPEYARICRRSEELDHGLTELVATFEPSDFEAAFSRFDAS